MRRSGFFVLRGCTSRDARSVRQQCPRCQRDGQPHAPSRDARSVLFGPHRNGCPDWARLGSVALLTHRGGRPTRAGMASNACPASYASAGLPEVDGLIVRDRHGSRLPGLAPRASSSRPGDAIVPHASSRALADAARRRLSLRIRAGPLPADVKAPVRAAASRVGRRAGRARFRPRRRQR